MSLAPARLWADATTQEPPVTEGMISPQLKQFITDYIDSVSQLEILLLLQTNPQQVWSAEVMARELRIEPTGAAQELTQLAAKGFLAPAPDNPATYHYAPRTPELQANVVALAQAYLVRRVTVISLIFSKSTDKLRVFADAFRIRKEPPNA